MSHHEQVSTREPSMQFPAFHHLHNAESAAVLEHHNFPVRRPISMIEIPTFLRTSLADSESLISLTSKSRRKNSLVAKELETTAAG